LNFFLGTCSTVARGAIALFAASVSESAATAAIVTLVHDWFVGAGFYVADIPAFSELDRPVCRSLRCCVHSSKVCYRRVCDGIGTAVCGFSLWQPVWMHREFHVRTKLFRSLVCVLAAAYHFRPGGADQILG